MEQPFLPYGRQAIDDSDIAAVIAALRSDWLTTGPAVEAFESALAEVAGAPYAVSCSSGTAALHLAVLAAGIGPGDTVIVPANTFLATANAVRYVGAEVAFADVDPETGLMTPDDALAALSRNGAPMVRAVMPVHFAGQCVNPLSMHAFAADHRLMVIEDACHALGTRYADSASERAIGACLHSDMATFSFHPVKTIAMGEGGAVTTRDAKLAARLRRLRNHGMTREQSAFADTEHAFDKSGAVNPWYYEMPEPGFNYRASDVHCALGRSQLARIDTFIDRRRQLVDQYAARLAAFAPIVRPLARAPGCNAAWHLQVVRIDFAAAGRSRAAVMERLRQLNIGSQVHYIPVPWQPYYRGRYGRLDLPGVASYYAQCLSLPLFATMDESDVVRVVSALADALGID